MLDLAFRDLSFPRLGSGRGADTTAPVASSVSYDTGTDTLTMAVSEACTLYALHNASATPLSAAAIQSGAEVTQALAAGVGYVDWDDSGWGAGTWWLHVALKDGAGNTTVLDPIEHVIAAPGFTETWGGYTVGDTFAQLDAAYSRSGSIIVGTVVTDADAANSKAVRVGVTSNAFHYMGRDDINAALAARTTERVQVLMQLRFVSTGTTQRAGMGRQASSLNTGLRYARTGANANSLGIQVAGDVNTATNFTSLASGLADLACYWVRMEIDGNDLKARHWLDGASEPGTWTTRTEASAIAFDNLNIIGRALNPCMDVLGYSVAIGADAPEF